MKFYKLVLLLLIISYNAEGQGCHNAGTPNFTKIKTSTLLIIKEPNDVAYNDLIIEAFNQHWKYCKFQVIEQKDLASYLEKPGYTYHGKIRFYDSHGYECNLFGLWGSLSKKDVVGKINDLRPLAYMHVENIFDSGTYTFCLSNIVKSLNDFLFFVDTHKFYGGMPTLFRSLSPVIAKDYNSKSSVLKGKTLLIPEDYVDEKGKSYFMGKYNGNVKFVSKNEIFQAIAGNDPNSSYLYLGQSPSAIFMYIVDIESSEIVYVQWNIYTYSNGMTKEQLKLKTNNLSNLAVGLKRAIEK